MEAPRPCVADLWGALHSQGFSAPTSDPADISAAKSGKNAREEESTHGRSKPEMGEGTTAGPTQDSACRQDSRGLRGSRKDGWDTGIPMRQIHGHCS